MRRDMNDNQLRIVGKAWEVRHTLRKLARAGGEGATLSSYLQSGAPTRSVNSKTGQPQARG